APVPQGVGLLARGLLSVQGTDTSFVGCDEDLARPVIDQTNGELQRAWAGLGAGGERIYLVVRAVDVRSPAQGPNARYRDALRITRVLRAARPGEGGGCHVPTPIWQFKARGNEPFWSVLVYSDSLVLQRPEGPGVVFNGAAPTSEDKAQLWNTATADKVHRMSLRLEDVGCVDDMSGEYFGLAATATVDGEKLKGCAEEAIPTP
ncbi:MAG TPA: hypothetical protein VLB12_08100, partial [Gemmatimonadales bacterium]|nr:hypothetical protein [Gemmatimonadales bacterium]